MAGLLSRFTTFIPNATILSNDHNQELNRIVNLLNGTTTNLKTVLKTSDAGDPPLELDQLSTGPIQEWFQGGILKASITNDGSFSTAGNLVVNNNTPQITLIDANNSKQMRIALNDTDWSFVNDTLGSANAFAVNTTNNITTFTQIPVGPASNPTTDNQFARKAYVDSQKTAWSVTWFYPSLPGAVETNESVGRFIVPPGNAITVTLIIVTWVGGSDSGASNIFTIKRRNNTGALQTDVGTIDVNSATQNVPLSNDISDLPLSAFDQIYPLLTTRNTASETLVSVTLLGTQKFTT